MRFSIFSDQSNEAIAPPWNGFDIRAPVRRIPQYLPQIKDAPGEVAFLNEHARPYLFQEFFFFDNMSGVFD